MLDSRLQTAGCLALAAVLVVGGTLATGLLPSGLPYQALAGLLIVAGFGLVLLCFADVDLPE